jgi:hypothetical protein
VPGIIVEIVKARNSFAGIFFLCKIQRKIVASVAVSLVIFKGAALKSGRVGTGESFLILYNSLISRKTFETAVGCPETWIKIEVSAKFQSGAYGNIGAYSAKCGRANTTDIQKIIDFGKRSAGTLPYDAFGKPQVEPGDSQELISGSAVYVYRVTG